MPYLQSNGENGDFRLIIVHDAPSKKSYTMFCYKLFFQAKTSNVNHFDLNFKWINFTNVFINPCLFLATSIYAI